MWTVGTPPSTLEGVDVSFQERLLAQVANARCTALPEYDSRSVNRCIFVFTPPRMTHRSAKSTSASAPGAWVCGTNPSASARRPRRRSPGGGRRRSPAPWSRTPRSAVLVDQPGEDPPGGVPLLARGVEVGAQHRIDHRFEMLQPTGHPHRRLPLRRDRRRQRLPDRAAVPLVPLGELPDRQPLDPLIAVGSLRTAPLSTPSPPCPALPCPALPSRDRRLRPRPRSGGARSNRRRKPGVS